MTSDTSLASGLSNSPPKLCQVGTQYIPPLTDISVRSKGSLHGNPFLRHPGCSHNVPTSPHVYSPLISTSIFWNLSSGRWLVSVKKTVMNSFRNKPQTHAGIILWLSCQRIHHLPELPILKKPRFFEKVAFGTHCRHIYFLRIEINLGLQWVG